MDDLPVAVPEWSRPNQRLQCPLEQTARDVNLEMRARYYPANLLTIAQSFNKCVLLNDLSSGYVDYDRVVLHSLERICKHLVSFGTYFEREDSRI